MSKLNIYRASAGSGKTFALTFEYFRLIFALPTEYKNILAVTFTNKATEEMKSRIIRELNKLAVGKPDNPYAEALRLEFGFTDEQLMNRAESLRTLLLHNYGRISVTTIDRFFQRVIKSFTKELGIFPGYNVELDSDSVLVQAVDKVMQQMKKSVDIRSWIRDLMNASVEEGKSWGVKARIAELGEELFKENYMLFDQPTLEKFNNKEFLRNYQQMLATRMKEYEDKLTVLGKKGCSIIKEAGLELRDFKGNRTGCASHFYKLADRNFDDPTPTARKSVDNIDWWISNDYDKANKVKIELIFRTLSDLLKECIDIYDNQHRYYNTAKHLSGNLYQLGILNDLYKEVRNYCNDNGLMLLSDTTHILNILIAGNDTPFLFEKTGNYYKHIMIDEFQDTSSMQWSSFKPLIVNSLSEGNHAMIVGDVKQSIYRWRNGDWSLLADGVQQEFKHFGTENVALTNNWRSAREIVDFNNLFFEKAARVLKAFYDKDAGENNKWSDTILNAYHDLRQEPKLQHTGYVDVLFGPEKREEDSNKQIMEHVVSVIQDIIDRGGQQRDIVILVRGGKEGAFVANYLMQYNKGAVRPIRFISNDSLYVWSSPYVKFITAILQYITEPYDLVNKTAIFYFYNSFVKDCDRNNLHNIFKIVRDYDVFSFLDTEFSINSGKIMSYSLFETVETIIDKFSLKDKQDEIPYLIAFQDIIFEYESSNSNSITLFLEWWEKEREKRLLSTSEGVNAVRILTIHKSKGLEFEYVILPFCSWELDSVRPVRCIWCRNKEKEFDELEYAPLNYSAKLSETYFEEDYYDEHLKAYVDNLNLLYVALTRTRTELYIRPYSPKFNKDGSLSMSDMGAFMYYVFSALKQEREILLPFEADMNLQYGKKQKFEKPEETTEEVLILKQYSVYDLANRVKVKYKYLDYTELDGEQLSAVDEGKLFHEIFKSIEYADHISRAVQNVYLAGLIPLDKKPEYGAMLVSYLSNPIASEWFDRKYSVIAERDILFHFGVKARPDRVIMSTNQTIVIDYKFGMKEEAKYLKQVKFYRTTLRQMGYKNVKGYVWYVRLNKVVQVE